MIKQRRFRRARLLYRVPAVAPRNDPCYDTWHAEGEPKAVGLWQRSDKWYRQNCRQRAVEWPVV